MVILNTKYTENNNLTKFRLQIINIFDEKTVYC